MIEKLGSNSHGVTEFAITSVAEVNNLPKRGIANTSTAILMDNGNIRIWFFKTEDMRVDGQWIEMV